MVEVGLQQLEVEQQQVPVMVPVVEEKTDKIDKMEIAEMVEEGAIEMEELILNKVETTLIFKTK